MKTHILFIQGAGTGAYEEDKLLAGNLQQNLGNDYKVHYPKMPNEEDVPYQQWKEKILRELEALEGHVILVGHSLGASVLAKVLSEVTPKSIHGLFLIANPFWGGDGWLYDGYQELELPKDFSKKIPKHLPTFLYHCQDDEIVPFDHLSLYAQLMPQATVLELEHGGHQLNRDLSVVAEDITSLKFTGK